MHAEPTINRGGIDEPAERARYGAPEIRAFGQRQGRRVRHVIPRDPPCDLVREQAGGVDETPAGHGRGLGAAGAQGEPAARAGVDGGDRRRQGEGAAAVLQVAAQGEQVAAGVEDSGLPRPDRRGAGERRLQTPRRGPVDGRKALDLVRDAAGEEIGDLALFGGVGRDDQLLRLPVSDAARGKVCIEQATATDAQEVLEAAGGIIEPGVNHAAVAGRRAEADRPPGFEDDDRGAPPRHLDGRRQSDDARANDDRVEIGQGTALRDGVVPHTYPYRPAGKRRRRRGARAVNQSRLEETEGLS